MVNPPSLKLNRCQPGRESWLNPQPLDVQRRIDVPCYGSTAARNILLPLDLFQATGAGDSTEQVRHNPGRIRTALRGHINWICLVQLAMQHETSALLYWHLQRICPGSVPRGILEPLAARFQSQTAEMQYHAQELVRIFGSLDQQGILTVV